MSSVSLMEGNTRTPIQWDWENLIMFNATATENPGKLQPAAWEVDVEGGIDTGSFYSSGGGASSGGSGSDLGISSLSKSSKSASINSSSVGKTKASKFMLETFEGNTEDSSYKKIFAKGGPNGTSSPVVEASVGSGEPLLSLKLGKQTYLEDVCVGSSSKSSSFSVTPVSSVTPAKRSKANNQSTLTPRCQVEGCNLDLSSAKDYHRKLRVCESHSKCPKVIVNGLERRFCQQCSRFHSLSEFDEKKRSCRRRLSDHNARRRKPHPDNIHLNPGRLSSTIFDGRQQMSLVWNNVPFFHSRPNEKFAWESIPSPKSIQTKGYIYEPAKIGGVDGLLHSPGNQLSNSIGMHGHNSSGFLLSKAGKGTTAEVLNQGVEETQMSSDLGTKQDFCRALSLLSTNSWGSCEQKHVSLDHSVQVNQNNVTQPLMHPLSQGFPIASSGYWQTDQQSTEPQMFTMSSQNDGSKNDGSSHFQKFRMFRERYDNGFNSDKLS